MFHSSEDKQYLAMLAIPVLLSIVFAMTGDSVLTNSVSNRDIDDAKLEESDKTKGKEGTQSEMLALNSRAMLDKKKLLTTALESRNYETFLLASVGTPFAEIMTQGAFEVLVDEYHLQKNGYQKSIYMDVDSGDFEV